MGSGPYNSQTGQGFAPYNGYYPATTGLGGSRSQSSGTADESSSSWNENSSQWGTALLRGRQHLNLTSGSASGSANGYSSFLNSTKSANYHRQLSNPQTTIAGTFYEFDSNSSNYQFNSRLTLDPVNGWVLSSGSGNSFAGAGGGEGYTGQGNYSLNNWLAAGGSSVLYTLNGTINENGFWNDLLGALTTYSVVSGAWVAAPAVPWESYSESTHFSNNATGSYSNGAILGTFGHQQSDDWSSNFGLNRSASGSGSGSSSASNWREDKDVSQYSSNYQGSGPWQMGSAMLGLSMGFGPMSGTLSESGSTLSSVNVTVDYAPSSGSGVSGNFMGGVAGDVLWAVTSGKETDVAAAANQVSFSSSGDYQSSDGGPDGTGVGGMDGTQSFNQSQGQGFNYTDNWTWGTTPGGLPGWQYSSGVHIDSSYASGSGSYQGSGGYTDYEFGGTMAGTENESGASYQSMQLSNTATFKNGAWVNSASGSSSSSANSQYSYDGAGDYTDGGITRTMDESGSQNDSSGQEQTYKLVNRVWQTQGSGSGSGGGAWQVSFGGNGNYTQIVPGGTIDGTQSESGIDGESWSYNYEQQLGSLSQWVLISGTGKDTTFGSYNYASTGSGNYTQSFDGDGVFDGTIHEGQNEGVSYSFEVDYSVAGNQWSATGNGGATGNSSNYYNYNGSGSYDVSDSSSDGTAQDQSTLSQSGGTGNSNQFQLTWDLGSSGVTWDSVSSSTSNASGHYDYSANGTASYADSGGDYAGGNGWTSNSQSSYNRSLTDNYEWTLSTTSNQSYANGTTTGWSNATGNGTAAGNAVSNWYDTANATSIQTEGGCAATTGWSSSGSGNVTDSYDATAEWTQDVGTNRSVTGDTTVDNNVAGSMKISGLMTELWETSYNYPAAGGMPAMNYSTSSSASINTGRPPQSYAQTVDYSGYYTGYYTNFGEFPPMSGGGQGYGGLPGSSGAMTSPPVVGATVTTPGANFVPIVSWTPPGGGASSAALAGGPWYPANLSTNTGPGVVVLSVDYSGMLSAGAGGEASFAQICASIDKPPPPPSAVDAIMAAPGAALSWLQSVPSGVSRALNWAWNDGLDGASNLFSGFADILTCGLTARYRDAIGAGSFVDRNSALYKAGQVAGFAESLLLGGANPCGAGAFVSIGVKAVNGIQAVGNAWNFADDMQAKNYGSAALDALGLMGNVSQMLRACFAAGTPLLTPDGWKPIEDFRVGDLLLSASEDDPYGPIEPRRVEEIFQRLSAIVEVRVCGQSIRTTAEHPFYVQGKGWTAAALLTPGDLFRSHDGRWNPVESINPTGEVATVYNMRIAEYHTYFVGSENGGSRFGA